MPKAKQGKRNSASKANPYSDAAAKTKAANSVFKMNTDIGQHVLKNPGIAQAIVDKAELKQSDVSLIVVVHECSCMDIVLINPRFIGCARNWSRYRKPDGQDP